MPLGPVLGLAFFWIWLLSGLSGLHAQTFSASVLDSIPDNGIWTEYPLTVSGISQPSGTSFGLESVCFTIRHPYVSDLQIHLVNPLGQTQILAESVGGDGDDFFQTVLGNAGFPPLQQSAAPFTGTFRAQQSLGLYNNGQSCNGTWKLRIRDQYSPDKGFLENWCLTFSNQPAAVFAFASSNLPILLISTGNQTILDEPKTPGRIKVLFQANGSRNYLIDSVGKPWISMGIELRGSSSQGFPKKSFGMEIRDRTGEDSSMAMLGMPAESDWVLSASYSDKSLMRNALAYESARKLGRYAPRTRFAEVILNGEYQGIYVITEKIKRDANRVNISRLRPTDVSGPDLTGGYIIKIDKATGNDSEGFQSVFLPQHFSNGQRVNYLFDYPKAEDLVPQQKAYIQAYVDSFEQAMNSPQFADPVLGYRRFANVESFIDMMLVNEFSKNVDGYRISTFLTKPKITQDGGRLQAGPIWDYDLAWRNADYCQGDSYTGWSYNFPNVCPDDFYQPPTWWKKFRTDPGFNNSFRCRWNSFINEAFPLVQQLAWVDSVANLLSEAQVRNFAYWPILGTYVWPNPSPIPSTYAGEVQNLKTWLQNRRQWMQGNIGGVCTVENQEVSPGKGPDHLICYPNPASDSFGIQGLETPSEVVLINQMGQVCRRWSSGQTEFSLAGVSAGLYWVRIGGKALGLKLMVNAGFRTE